VFGVDDRERVRERVLALAAADGRIVAAAEVGSRAAGGGDRWSDLDLTFAVADDTPVSDVLADWTRELTGKLGAAHLFDLPRESTVYRVFLLPGCLQVDLSFTPAAEFGAAGPRFRLLFGSAVEREHALPPAAHDLFGQGVHHLVRARFAVERGRPWEAEYWISAARDCALSLACLARGLPARYGRAFDRLPAELLDEASGALVRSLEREELLRALERAADALLRHAGEAHELAARVAPNLRDLVSPGFVSEAPERPAAV
jgi:hypothetical protein